MAVRSVPPALAPARLLVLGLAAVLAAVWLAPPQHAFEGLASYLPLHSSLEVVSIVIASLAFGIVWNAYSRERPASQVMLGCALLAVALIDFAHLLSYAGMPDFVTPSGPEKAIYFWLSARFLAAATLLGAALMPRQPLAQPRLRFLMLAIAVAIALAVYWTVLFHEGRLPSMFVEGVGLTPAKVAAEYGLVLLFASAAALLYRRARGDGAPESAWLMAAAAVSALSELCFALYAQVTDVFNLLGHVYKFIAYGFIYRAVFVAGVRAPFVSAQEAQARYRLLARVSPVGIFSTDAQGRCVYVNERWCELAGLSPAEALGDGWVRAVHMEDRERVAERWRRTASRGEPFSLEYRFCRPDGSVTWVLGRAEPVHDSAGEGGHVGTITDIDELKRAEWTLRERMKEQRGLYQVSELASRPGLAPEELLQSALDPIRRAFQFPERTAVRIRDGERSRETPGFRANVRWRIETVLEGVGGTVGAIEVAYLGDWDGRGGEGPFLAEERVFIESVARTLATSMRRAALEEALRDGEAALRHAQEMAHLAHVVVDTDGTYERWSESWPKLIGVQPSQVPRSNRDFLPLVHPEDRDRFRAAAREAARGGRTTVLEYRMPRAGAGLIHIRQTMEPIAERTRAGRSRWFVTVQEVTAQKQAEHRIERLNRVYAVLSGINAAIVRIRERQELFDEACRLAVVQGHFRFAWICGRDRAAQSLVPVASAGDGDDFLERIAGRLSLRDDAPNGHGVAAVAVREMRAIFVNDVEADPLIANKPLHRERGIGSVAVLPILLEGSVVAALGLHSADPGFFDQEEQRLLLELAGDIAFALDHIAKEEKVRYLAYYDPLTGLANRTLLLDRLAQHFGAAQREQRQVALAIVNIDRFKSINDAFGRQMGDALLRQVALRLVSATGDPANVARVGADQFAVVAPEVRREESLIRRLEEGNRQVDGEPYVIDGTEMRISTRAGVAVWPQDGADPDTLFRNAEAALKNAAAGDRFLFYAPSMTARLAERLRLENQLRRALERREFVLHYQPKVDLVSRRIVGAEALIRWRNPELGLVPPADFIPLLEQTGMIIDAGAWAIEQALADRARWRRNGGQPPRVAVNVSARQLLRPGFAASLQAGLCGAPDGGGLDLEITESLLMQDIERNIAALDALRAIGVEIAVDDFGTGYSSLAYLAKLPVAALKIDRSFVAAMESPDATSLVSTIISLGHSLRLKVVAEGVETEQQAKYLALLRCDEAQGFYFGRPVPTEQFADMLEKAPIRNG